jgi:hypothetical protein
MKHRRLKAASPRRTNLKLTVYDRQAVQLPVNAEIAVVMRPDPYEAGAMQTMAASLRGDPLLSLHARQMIADYQFAAGREWQRYYEQAQIGALKGADTTCEPVDGGRVSVEYLTDAKRKAIAKLTYCRAILGETGNAIVTLVLGGNLPIQQAALARGMVTRREVEYVGQRFREALSELARVFGYA